MQKIFFIFIIIGFSIPIISFLIEYIPNPSIYQERKETMKNEFENIKPPVNSKEISKTITSKVTQIWIGSKYSVDMQKEEIEKYYKKELSEKGWVYEKTSKEGELKFKKNSFLFTLKAEKNNFRIGFYYDGDGPNF
ncbi:hypothetical protein [Anaerosinus sp.]|uniref:hypothetical protein n=1 Tax=Selenobaculum sp. TaxID=3074374 RepID=UPI003AB7656A